MIHPRVQQQFNLLVRVLPYVVRIDEFAIKGGTAINLFHVDLPRLSIDIDLTYLPVQDRATALRGITDLFARLRCTLEENIPNIRKLKEINPIKHDELINKLKRCLDSDTNTLLS